MPQPGVPQSQMQIVRAIDVRRSLTVPGDVKTEVTFQNDINALIARFDEARVPWLPLGGTLPALQVTLVPDATPIPIGLKPLARRSRRVDATMARLRVVDGGLPPGPSMDLLGITPSPIHVTPAPTVTLRPAAAATSGRASGNRQPRRRG